MNYFLSFFRWQDYEANLGSGFRELRKDNEFMDVTLCCDNGVDKVQAHKLILVSRMKIHFLKVWRKHYKNRVNILD